MASISEKFDFREAFRQEHIMRRGDDGKFVYRGQSRHLLNIIASFVKPDHGTFFLSMQMASDLLGVELRPRGRGPAATLFAQFRRDGIIEQVSRGGNQGGKARATTYRVVVSTPLSQGGRKVNPPKSEQEPPLDAGEAALCEVCSSRPVGPNGYYCEECTAELRRRKAQVTDGSFSATAALAAMKAEYSRAG